MILPLDESEDTFYFLGVSTLRTKGRASLARWMEQGPRRERGQTAIGRVVGVKQPAVGQWLRGITRPEAQHRIPLQTLTGIPSGDWDLPEEKEALEAALDRARAAIPPEPKEKEKKHGRRSPVRSSSSRSQAPPPSSRGSRPAKASPRSRKEKAAA